LGHTYVFEAGGTQVEHHYASAEYMQYKVLTGPRAGSADTVAVDIKLIRPSVFLVSWQERDNTRWCASRISTQAFYNNATAPAGCFIDTRAKCAAFHSVRRSPR